MQFVDDMTRDGASRGATKELPDSPFLTIPEAAAFWRCSRDSIVAYIRRGGEGVYYVGGWRLNPDEMRLGARKFALKKASAELSEKDVTISEDADQFDIEKTW